IEQKAIKDKNQTQLLKTYLFRPNIFSETIEEDPSQYSIKYLETKVGQLDAVHNAILHAELARSYFNYCVFHIDIFDFNPYNTPIEGDITKVNMKYWDKATFQTVIDRHFAEALKPVEALKKARTKDFVILYDNYPDSAQKNLMYEPSMYEFLLHCAAYCYSTRATNENINEERSTDSWWKPAAEFAKDELGDSDSPWIHALKLYQKLIAYSIEQKNNDLLVYNDYKRLKLVNNYFNDKDLYKKSLETLKKRYPDNPVTAEISLDIAKMLVEQYDLNEYDSTYFDNLQKAKALYDEIIAKFPNTSYAEQSKEIISSIESPYVSLRYLPTQLPNEPIPAVLEYKNVTHPYYRIVKINRETYSGKIDADFLQKKEIVAEGEFDLPAETDYRTHTTLVLLPPLEIGRYYIVCSVNKDSIFRGKIHGMDINVSNLNLIVDGNCEKITVHTLDRKTGTPIEGVDVDFIYDIYDSQTKKWIDKIENVKSDRNGTVEKTKIKNSSIQLRKGEDTFYLHNYEFYYDCEYEKQIKINLFTDRAIYRPGQTVHFQGVVACKKGDNTELYPNYAVKIDFCRGYQEIIDSAVFVTDEYGSFSGSFVIPSDCVAGLYQLTSNQALGGHFIRVENYKRPTFEVKFETPEEQYKLNQDVTVRGSVKAYAGFGLDNVEYSYSVVRSTSFPWRCSWWNYPSVKRVQIAHGKARTDKDGKFEISFNLKPGKEAKPKLQPLFSYTIEVTATSAQGETHTEKYSLRAGYNEMVISTDFPIYNLSSRFVEKSEMDKCKIFVRNMSRQPARSRISRKIYRYNDDGKINYFEPADSYGRSFDRKILSDSTVNRLFPNYRFYQAEKVLVFSDIITVNDSAGLFDKLNMEPGKYVVELQSLDDPLAFTSEEFSFIDKKSKKMPFSTLNWCWSDKDYASPGEKITFLFGSSAKDAKMLVQLTSGNKVILEKWITLNNEVQTLSYTLTEQDCDNHINLNTVVAKDNALIWKHCDVFVGINKLDVQLATVRDNLTPGSKEKWEIRVHDKKGKPQKSALLAGMYDASLDVFAGEHWWFLDTYWYSPNRRLYVDNNYMYRDAIIIGMYGTPKYFYNKKNITLSDLWQQRVLVLPGYSGEALKCVVISEKDPLIDKGSPEAGKRITAEDLVVSNSAIAETQPIDGDDNPNAKSSFPTLRENFNETAFFFPQLRTNADGSATISFTTPDALTRWRLLLFAYTKDLRQGCKEYTFTTSKPMMIMADMPRYIYDNDTIWLVANVINTGNKAVTPTAKLEIFDAATMKPVDILISKALIPMETIEAGRSHEVRWQVAARHDLGLLACRFTATEDNFSDAEQHLLPVLSSEVLMTQTLPITVKANTEKTFDFNTVADSNERDHSLTLNFSTNPLWYAVQALPYLADQNTNRAESAFYVFYANTLASHIANKIPNLLNYIKKWQIETPDALLSQLEKDQDLKAIMLQETPWVLEAKSESEQRRRIATLFDIEVMHDRQCNALGLISSKQTYSGGWSWMEGMPESEYITTYILTGFGKLQKMGAWESLDNKDKNKAENICKKAVRFLEGKVAEDYRYMKNNSKGKDWAIGATTLAELYALSFFDTQSKDTAFATAKKYYLDRLEKDWKSFSFNYQAKAAMVLSRNGNTATAKLMVQSFRECAQKNDDLGMYWPKKYFSLESHIATHANIMSAFAEIDNNQQLIDQMRVWLLTQKQTNSWENSSSTADAIYALLMRGSDWYEEGKAVTLSFGKTSVGTGDGAAGTGFVQRRWNANEITPDMRQLTVNNPTGHLVWGGLFRQYFVPVDKVKNSESGMKITRELFVEKVTEKGKVLVPVPSTSSGTGAASLKVGDKVTVRITVESLQDLSYVLVKDLRAAGFEPTEQISRYRYRDGIGFYQSSSDSDMRFFIKFLPKGTHQLEYSMFVTKEGLLNNGYALIQCQYAPEFSAYSNGMKVRVGN
ncbi:MAG: hypothetical protein IKX51_02425, partial [Bacteroidales bacterium]|nr:hypothetical protein [Bacteroidales bacterium]